MRPREIPVSGKLHCRCGIFVRFWDVMLGLAVWSRFIGFRKFTTGPFSAPAGMHATFSVLTAMTSFFASPYRFSLLWRNKRV
jgi:hypothetical protein